MNAIILSAQDRLSSVEIGAALDAFCQRMDVIEAQCGQNFPLFSPGVSSVWTVSQGGSWIGGFWGACWWLRSHLQGSHSDQKKASLLCMRLGSKINLDSVNRSMLFWYGAALGAQLTNDMQARETAHQAAFALFTSFDERMQCIPTGAALGGGVNGARHISIDALASIITLLRFDDRKPVQDVAQKHTQTVVNACLKSDGACYTGALYAQGKCLPIDQAGIWSRGQAWGMLGLAEAAKQWGEPYVGHAHSACEYWLRSRAQMIPPNRLFQTDSLPDPSAVLIASLAMLTLSTCHVNTACWKNVAESQIAMLVRSSYFTRGGDAYTDVLPGIFWGACYQIRPEQFELVESAWSTFLLMQALCLLDEFVGVTDPTLKNSHIYICNERNQKCKKS